MNIPLSTLTSRASGLNVVETLTRQQRMALAHWQLWKFGFSGKCPEDCNTLIMDKMTYTFNESGGAATFEYMRLWFPELVKKYSRVMPARFVVP